MVLNPQVGHVMNQRGVEEDSSEDDMEEESDDSTVMIYTGPPGRALV